MWKDIREGLVTRFMARKGMKSKIESIEKDIFSGKISPAQAAQKVLAELA